MIEYIVQGTGDGRVVKMRVFAQTPGRAVEEVKRLAGVRSWSTANVTKA